MHRDLLTGGAPPHTHTAAPAWGGGAQAGEEGFRQHQDPRKARIRDDPIIDQITGVDFAIAILEAVGLVHKVVVSRC